MSVPKRHHYVPQAHIRHFKQNDFYELYFKNKEEFKYPRSSKDFFVKSELNTLGSDFGKDHSSFEKELAIKWDNKYNFYLKKITDVIKDQSKILEQETLKFFFEYGIIGYMRRHKMEKEFNDNYFSFTEVFPDIEEALNSYEIQNDEFSDEHLIGAREYYSAFMNEVKKMMEKQEGLKFPSIIASDARMFVPKLCSCLIYRSKKDVFVLPDSTMQGLKSNKKFIWGGAEFNQIEIVGIPLTPKIYISIVNSDVNHEIKSEIINATDDMIKNINKSLILNSFDQVLFSADTIIS
ncbi:MAG: DUF4238 domain-containing protein [Crocinitomicaceae bacterium]|nr:DUF4238 domain-containing protein [Crocinitomicaceae bacterium]